QHGLCLLRHRIRHQENDCSNEKGGIDSHSYLSSGPYVELQEPISAIMSIILANKEKSAVKY
ncbi:MAG: hypothetical protein J6X31_07305, partial [Bacteroidales bacterium]|nr:hypothetical protein [Bacteroidales bacterium]